MILLFFWLLLLVCALFPIFWEVLFKLDLLIYFFFWFILYIKLLLPFISSARLLIIIIDFSADQQFFMPNWRSKGDGRKKNR